MSYRQRCTRRRRPMLEALEDRFCLTSPATNAIQSATLANVFPEPIKTNQAETFTFVLEVLDHVTGAGSLVSGFSDGNNDDFTGTKINFNNPFNNPAHDPGDVLLTDPAHPSQLVLGSGTLSNGDHYTASLGDQGGASPGYYTIVISHTYPTSAAGTTPPLVLTLDDNTTQTFSPPAGPPNPPVIIGGVSYPWNMLGQTIQLGANQAPQITSANTTTFNLNTAGTFSVVATGSPVPTISESDTLPSWLHFTDNGDGTGTLSGTPTSTTGSPIIIHFTAKNGISPNASQTFTLNLKAVPVAPQITSANTINLTNGTAGSFKINTTGSPPVNTIKVVTGTLPVGLSFHDNGDGTATISGTPNVQGLSAGQLFSSSLGIVASNGVAPDAPQLLTIEVRGTQLSPNQQILNDLATARTSIDGIAYDEQTINRFNDPAERAILKANIEDRIKGTQANLVTIKQEIAADPDTKADDLFRILLAVQEVELAAEQIRWQRL